MWFLLHHFNVLSNKIHSMILVDFPTITINVTCIQFVYFLLQLPNHRMFSNFFSADLVTGFFLWYDFTKYVSLTKFHSMFDIGHCLPTGWAPSECGQWNAADPLHLTRSSSRNSIGKSVSGIGSFKSRSLATNN